MGTICLWRSWWDSGAVCLLSELNRLLYRCSRLRLVTGFAAYPIDTLRFRMQCELVKGSAQGTQLVSKTARRMWASGWVRTFYRGLFWGLVGQFPYSAIDLTTFEYTKQWLIRRNERNGFHDKDAHPGAVATATIGGFSGAFGASVLWPLNMLRTRLQT